VRGVGGKSAAGLKKDKEALEEAKTRLDSLTTQAGKLKKLSDDLAGKNSQNLPFVSWLLRNHLSEAAAWWVSFLM